MSVDQALNRLKDGNKRYVDNCPTYPHRTPERRKELAGGQSPFAAILTCSDSRVVPEIIFDQGLGDLFVVRLAGHVIDDTVLGTLEYGAARLKVPLVVVLGHTRCGAVTAAVKSASSDDHISTLTDALQPAVEMSRGSAGDPVENAVRENVMLQVERLRRSGPVFAELCEAHRLRVVGAVYDIETGEIEWLQP
jgi:carbonic anhydrase